MPFSLAELAAQVGGEIHNDRGEAYHDIAAFAQADTVHIGLIGSERYLAAGLASRAGAFVVAPKLTDRCDRRPLLVTPNPQAIFARITALFHPEPALRPGIHPTAIVDATAQIGEGCEIGPQVVIGAGVVIGNHSRIGAGGMIGDDCTIGPNALFHPRVTLYAKTQIGARVILHSGCVLGSDGFGNALEDGHWIKIPQIGRVIVGDDCEIGANTCIDRGALEDTVIGNGVRLDNLIHIAHNCQIGDDTAMAACVGIAGSTKIGRRCQIGGAAMIIGHLEIGDDVMVSAATFIGKSLPKPGAYTSVMPQQPHAEWIKNAAHLRHLHDLHERIRTLEKGQQK